MTQRENHTDLSVELERRIEELEQADDPSFGSFGGLDWLLLIITCIVIPVIVAYLFR